MIYLFLPLFFCFSSSSFLLFFNIVILLGLVLYQNIAKAVSSAKVYNYNLHDVMNNGAPVNQIYYPNHNQTS